jgi:hypothetical protein
VLTSIELESYAWSLKIRLLNYHLIVREGRGTCLTVWGYENIDIVDSVH